MSQGTTLLNMTHRLSGNYDFKNGVLNSSIFNWLGDSYSIIMSKLFVLNLANTLHFSKKYILYLNDNILTISY